MVYTPDGLNDLGETVDVPGYQETRWSTSWHIDSG